MSNGSGNLPPGVGRQLPSYMQIVNQAAMAAKSTNLLSSGGQISLVLGANNQRIPLNVPQPSATMPNAQNLWPVLVDTAKSYFENPAPILPGQGQGQGGFPFDFNSPQGRVTSFLFFQGMNPNVSVIFLNPTLWSAVSGFLDHLVASIFGPDAVGMPEAYLALQTLFQSFRQAGGRITAPGGLLSSFSPGGAALSGFLAGFSGGAFDVFQAALQMKIFSFSGSGASLVNVIHALLTKVADAVSRQAKNAVQFTRGQNSVTVNVTSPPPLRLVAYANNKDGVIIAGANSVTLTGLADTEKAYVRFGEALAVLAVISNIISQVASLPPSAQGQAEHQRLLDYFDANKTPWQNDSIWVDSNAFRAAFTDLEGPTS